jgi:small nuclear ribonucleoprotein (snRNP)-like protein
MAALNTIGVPLRLLHEAEGHAVTVELKSGDLYRGHLQAAENTMNVQLLNVVHTARDGRVTKLVPPVWGTATGARGAPWQPRHCGRAAYTARWRDAAGDGAQPRRRRAVRTGSVAPAFPAGALAAWADAHPAAARECPLILPLLLRSALLSTRAAGVPSPVAQCTRRCRSASLPLPFRRLEHVYLRGNQVRFVVLPEILKNAPLFK